MKFSERLELLGFSSYEQYLASPHWKGFKEVYCRSGMPVTCAVCGCSRTELHHRTYKRLGGEFLQDVIPLCRQHHEAVHEKLKEAGKLVEHSKWAIATLKGVVVQPGEMKQKKTKKGKTAGHNKMSKKDRQQAKKARKKVAREHWNSEWWCKLESLPRLPHRTVADVVAFFNKCGVMNGERVTSKAWELRLYRHRGHDSLWHLQNYLKLLAECKKAGTLS